MAVDDYGPALGAKEGFLYDRRWMFGSDDAANGHEETGEPGEISLAPLSAAKEGAWTNPNVAPEPSMYCPNVRMMPFWPAPYRKMFTVPVPSLVKNQSSCWPDVLRTEYEADNDTDSWSSS